ncbi:hypothetical protein N656DRAFT_518327 [Canariomyces notabilis]|uniref:Heterokaryon incompatibility domain-containing protein n=1 Tax=Canariomyces notabilis TaxID=2074819 RepID=A0AAN6QBT5_9PEZI|nr:hypothetical protein N656DRAFT_518327 [Canariomyces arenarius]
MRTFQMSYRRGEVLGNELSAFLEASGSQSDSHPLQVSRAPRAGPDAQLPFICRSTGGCECGPLSAPKGSSLYSNLPSDDYIRVLEVLPGVSPEVECRMHICRLPDDVYTYEALSYTWKLDDKKSDNVSDVLIRCNGYETAVGINLAAALRKVRECHTSRYIWVDALCINQKMKPRRAVRSEK